MARHAYGGRTTTWDEERLARLRYLFMEDGISAPRIAERMGCSLSTINRKLKDLGLEKELVARRKREYF